MFLESRRGAFLLHSRITGLGFAETGKSVAVERGCRQAEDVPHS
jgi:hypothetical protein